MKKFQAWLTKSVRLFAKREKPEAIKILADKKQEFLIRLGREQFQKLIDKGLSIPVMTL